MDVEVINNRADTTHYFERVRLRADIRNIQCACACVLRNIVLATVSVFAVCVSVCVRGHLFGYFYGGRCTSSLRYEGDGISEKGSA